MYNALADGIQGRQMYATIPPQVDRLFPRPPGHNTAILSLHYKACPPKRGDLVNEALTKQGLGMVEVHSLTPTSREAISSYEARTLQPLTVFGVRHASVSVSDTDTTLVLRSIVWTLQVSTCPMSVSVLVLHRFPGIETVTSRSQGNKLVLAPRLTFYLIQRCTIQLANFTS